MFLQAGSPAELRAYMAQYPDSRCIAGGTDIMPVQNRENDREAVFIDISGAAALHRIVSEDGVLSVGAAATFAEIERNALLRQYAPVLCLAASQVGSPQIRNLGTIGGNVAHGSPAADTLPVLAQWKCMRSGEYVLGIEPTNSYIMGRSAERENGTIGMLQPFETRRMQVTLRFFDR